MGLDLAEAVVSAMTGAAQVACSLLDLARRAAEGIEMVIVTNELDYEAASIAAILGDEARVRGVLTRLVERSEARGLHRFAERYRKELASLD